VPLDEELAIAADDRASLGATRDVRDAVTAVLETLSPDYREVLIAKYCDGLAVNEIAAASGRTPKAVESLLSRAREAFRSAWPEPRSAR
jgi:RNA polymerase sigma-70 factor (ECF subfamily)